MLLLQSDHKCVQFFSVPTETNTVECFFFMYTASTFAPSFTFLLMHRLFPFFSDFGFVSASLICLPDYVQSQSIKTGFSYLFQKAIR